MKSLLKQKHADQTSQPNGYNTRHAKLETVDPNRPKALNSVDIGAANQGKQPAMQGAKRGFTEAFSPALPLYASTVSVQHANSRTVLDDDSEYSSSAASYTQPAKKATGSHLRDTLAQPRDSDNGRQKNRPGRKPTKAQEHLTDEEIRRLEERRLKNKEAAQRCRQRRVGKIQELEARIKLLNSEISLLKTTHERYKTVPTELQYFIGPKAHVCCLASTPPARPIQMPLVAAIAHDSPFNRPSPSKQDPSSNKAGFKGLNSPTVASRALGGPIKRPTFLNRPVSNLINEQKRPSSQPSPSVMNSFLPSFGTPGQPDFLTSWANNGTPGMPSFGANGANGELFAFDDRTPSRELTAGNSILCQALDLQSSFALETPNTETPRLTAL